MIRIELNVLRAMACALVLMGEARVAFAQEIIDRVLAVAAGRLIMLSDVMAARDFGLVSPGASSDPVRAILSRLIERALVLAEVDRYEPPAPDANEVARALETVRARFSSPEAFAGRLARAGVDEVHLRETLRDDLRIRAYLDQRFMVAPPGDEELGRYYREHSDLFTRNGQLAPFSEVRSEVAQALVTDRRRTLVEEWIGGLRRRAEVVDLYGPGMK